MTGHANSERLSSYLDEELDAKDAQRLAGHLEQCETCRRQLDGLRRVMGDLRSLEEASPPAGLGLKLHQRLAQEMAPASHRRGLAGHSVLRPFFQPAFLGSLGVILALGVIMVMFSQVFGRGRPEDFQGRQSSGSVSVLPTDRVEVAGRAFEVMGGIWVESDLTVAEVADARVVDRSDLLSLADTPAEVREILGRLDGQVTLRARGETLRVSAVATENR